MKKYKDLRMTIVCGLLLLAFIVLAIFSYLDEDKIRLIIALIASLFALIMMVTKYKHILFDDMMIIYQWQVAAMLPVVIKYKDIKDVTVKSKHCVVIEHKKTSKVYVFNAEDFVKGYNKLRK